MSDLGGKHKHRSIFGASSAGNTGRRPAGGGPRDCHCGATSGRRDCFRGARGLVVVAGSGRIGRESDIVDVHLALPKMLAFCTAG